MCVCAVSLQLCLTLCVPVDCSLPDSSFHGILQARKLEWVATPSSRASSQTRGRTHISYISRIGRQVPSLWCHLCILRIWASVWWHMGFPGALVVKHLPANVGDIETWV